MARAVEELGALRWGRIHPAHEGQGVVLNALNVSFPVMALDQTTDCNVCFFCPCFEVEQDRSQGRLLWAAPSDSRGGPPPPGGEGFCKRVALSWSHEVKRW